ncbi:glycosyltransferase [Burkholderia vietnamiensis]|jgi:glycosyltransferase involved in cell wall biosynthesis|uniref:Glycosyltransferase family 4 protein n=1 Tax=Burkholderia vietnamiensis TaxID=60552 RepID=A0AAW7SX39_BURVI|nr:MULTISPECIES: glycosyltransferase family 4 protein [Burkholderia]AFJ89036.1 Glycosyltransferase [Burkholderia sp. KJ006]KKI38628.1 glycosyl transferase family 1 [Burkholderia vietnamiensis]KVF09372.1 glycosyl transferase family 1 [Burkholderia vietnamiensis]KVF34979.1 glycosyl transferase family 1 [Burkholderia vietnamiensis]KVF92257.1 glycosyl transferase family 1 [Burkholderia vietnamiensis]
MNRDLAEHALNFATADAAAAGDAVLRRTEAPARASARDASRPLRVAIVHDWLVTYAGAERVLEQIIACFPDADLFSLVDFLDDRAFVRGKPVTTSFIQKLPFARTKYRSYLPLMPLAIEQLDVSDYDLVISSSHAVAKGVLTGPDQLHISYVHSPIRYAWDLQHQYLEQSNLTHGPKSLLARMILHYIRNWDTRTANAVDGFIANSAFIARRIRKVYHRDAAVIFPPVDVDGFSLNDVKDDFYLTASRMVPYKKIDLIVEAFSRTPERKLVVIGDGPEMQKIRAKAGPNVEIMGYQPFAVLHDRMRRAKAFVFAAEEDFGISVVEAQACGTPVIAYGKGGALETVLEPTSHAHPTGLFFDEQTPHAIVAAVDEFERAPQRFAPRACRANAERFSADTFRQRFLDYVEAALPGSTAQRSTAVAPLPVARGPATLVLDQSGVLGGAELSLLEIMKHMRANADVLLFDDGPFRAALDEIGARVDVLDQGALAGVRKQGGVSAGALKQLVALVRNVARRARRAEVIYANTQRAMVVAALAGRLARKPVVWHLRDIVSGDHFGGKQLKAIKYCARFGITRVIANSDASAQAFRALTGFTPQHVDVVFNGISAGPFDALENVSQAALRARFGLPEHAWLVGSFSRLAHWKGQHLLLEAATRHPDMHVVLVGAPLFGEDEYAAQLHETVARHRMGDRVHFLGFQRDVAACMKAVDMVAHTSITPEPFGRVIVEGMLARRPVVAARAGGVVEIIEDGENGLLCEPGNAAALADALGRLKHDGALRERLVASGRATAVRRFGTETYVERVEKILADTAKAAKAKKR